MNLKTFLAEEKELRKQRKLEKKKAKKAPKTKEQKKYRVAGIIVGILVVFGALFNGCKSCSTSDFNWNQLVGISDEMIVALEKPVDTNLLLPNGTISGDDFESCKTKLNSVGVDIEKMVEDEELKANTTFVLGNRELGSLIKEILVNGISSLKDSESLNLNLDVLDFEIYQKDDDFYEKSIVLVSLTGITGIEDLPDIYLTSISRIEVLDGSIYILDTSLKINQIEDSINEEFLKLLNSYSNFKLIEIGNAMINTTINLFSDKIGARLALIDNGIEFRI